MIPTGNELAAPPAALQIDGLKVARSGRVLLDELALRIPAGGRISIQGPSGCGKTTLLRIVSGLDTPDAGEVRLAGRLATQGKRLLLRPWERGVQMVFQDLGLWPTRKVLANVEDAVRAAGLDAPRERARRTLASLGLEALAERRVTHLSGGEARRLAFARALALEPALLLLDEPFTSLDPDARRRGFALLEEVAASTAAALVLVTHDPEEAARLGGEQLRLEGGRLA